MTLITKIVAQGLTICSLALQTRVLAQSCYLPNGQPPAAAKTNFYAPCSFGIGHDGYQTCCKTLYPFNQTCLPNGLCLVNATVPSLGLSAGIFRGPCTDPSSKSPSCVNICNTGPDPDNNTPISNQTEAQVKQCDNGSFCCGTENTTISDVATQCCANGNGFFISDNGTITLANATTSSSASPQATPSTSPAPVSSPSHSNTPAPASSTNVGAIAGGTVGGVAALAIIGGLLFFFLRRRKSKRNETTYPPDKELLPPPPLQETDGKAIPWEAAGSEIAEKDSVDPVRRDRMLVTELQG